MGSCTHSAGLSPRDKAIPICLDRSPEHLFGDITRTLDRKGQICAWKLRVGFDDCRCHDAECAASTTTKGPEKILILGFTGSDESSVRCHDFKCQYLERSDHDNRCGLGNVPGAEDKDSLGLLPYHKCLIEASGRLPGYNLL